MFQKATLQGVALILFKFCLISEAQPHSSNTTSHPIFSFPHSLIFSFSNFSPAYAARTLHLKTTKSPYLFLFLSFLVNIFLK